MKAKQQTENTAIKKKPKLSCRKLGLCRTDCADIKSSQVSVALRYEPDSPSMLVGMPSKVCNKSCTSLYLSMT